MTVLQSTTAEHDDDHILADRKQGALAMDKMKRLHFVRKAAFAGFQDRFF